MICNQCEQDKSRTDFYSRKSGQLVSHTCKKCTSKNEAERSKEKHHALRLRCLRHYGGDIPVCACCKEAHLEFLAIDHINGGGNQHRRENGENLYRWLRKNGFPEGYRVLCHNCNMAIGLYGKCPHEAE